MVIRKRNLVILVVIVFMLGVVVGDIYHIREINRISMEIEKGIGNE